MPATWVREFVGGLDSRRLPEASAGGTLIRAVNGHITRGGEFEKRAAFVPFATLPAGTIGLAAGAVRPTVFGTGTRPPALSASLDYQQLQHPDGVTALSRILSYDLFAAKLYVVGQFVDGSVHHFYDGARIAQWFDGRARASFEVTNGGPGGAVTAVLVGGVDVLGAPIPWAGSASATAAAIAAQITSNPSAPEYTGAAAGNRVSVVAQAVGTTLNGLALNVNVTAPVAVTLVNPTMSGGASSENTYTPGTFVLTVQRRMFAVSGQNTHFSGIQQPTQWLTGTVGAGFIDMSAEASGSEDLQALVRYQNYVAVFASRTIQIWFFDPDPALSRQVQVLQNTGTIAPRSVTSFGDNDVFYLDESGLRSLRARDSSNAAFTSDIGNPVDTLIKQAIAEAPDPSRAVGIIEPTDGRFWLGIGSKIFVFSFFTGSKISAWTTYELPFSIDDMVVFRRRVYVRAGDSVYVYGGTGRTPIYDETVAEAWLPYLDGNAPARRKQLTGVDVACSGVWQIRAGMQPTDIDVSDKIATVTGTTYNLDTIPAMGEATHLSLRFRSLGSGPAIVGAAVLHYESEDED